MACVSCSSIGNRIIHTGYFTGVRGDIDLITCRESPAVRKDTALAVLDLPFSFVGDMLFLPYDATREHERKMKLKELPPQERERQVNRFKEHH